jgi:hypothetical protein
MPADPNQLDALGATAEHNGVRVWSVVAATQQELADQIALILGEHMTNDDELHITHAVIPTSSQDKIQPRFLRHSEAYTELFSAYSAVLVLRSETDA